MTKLDELATELSKFKTLEAKIKANKGGSTWVQVQKTAAAMSVAVSTNLPLIRAALASAGSDAVRNAKVGERVEKLSLDVREVNKTMASVSTYITQHSPGGAKVRGILSTDKAKAEEKVRVGLAGDLVRQFGLMQMTISQLRREHPGGSNL